MARRQAAKNLLDKARIIHDLENDILRIRFNDRKITASSEPISNIIHHLAHDNQVVEIEIRGISDRTTWNDLFNSLPDAADLNIERVRGLWVARLDVAFGLTIEDWAHLVFVGVGKQPVAAIRAAIERYEQDRRLLESGENE